MERGSILIAAHARVKRKEYRCRFEQYSLRSFIYSYSNGYPYPHTCSFVNARLSFYTGPPYTLGPRHRTHAEDEDYIQLVLHYREMEKNQIENL
jgi:hypothetical protein